MAHFAKLDENNNVIDVIVVADEHEAYGEQWCQEWSGYPYWKQTSYNDRIRKNYASIGGVYDPVRDAFITPKPYPSWVLDETTCRWEAPVPYPNDDHMWLWDEENVQWVQSPFDPEI